MTRNTGSIAALILMLGGLAGAAQAADVYRYVPANAFQLRMGYYLPEGGGTFWDDVEQRFTFDANDFNGAAWGVTFIGGITPYFEFGVNADWYQRTVRSEERYYVDTDGFSIVHDTTFRQFPLAVDLRLVPGGRRPGKPVFFLGAGAGLNIWEYVEVGDFVDEGDPDLPIYYAVFESSGESLEGRVLAGLEVPVSPAFHLTFEGRYTFAEADLDGDLAGLGTIDTGGGWMFAGASFRF
jgi:opacity protein-like surface antigen